jgi:hypothetical protein
MAASAGHTAFKDVAEASDMPTGTKGERVSGVALMDETAMDAAIPM